MKVGIRSYALLNYFVFQLIVFVKSGQNETYAPLNFWRLMSTVVVVPHR